MSRRAEARVRRTSTRARGYGHRHQQLRKRVALVVAQGRAICGRCGEPISPLTDKWDLDHVDGIDKRLGVYRGPAHQAETGAQQALPPNDDDKPKRKNRHWHSSTPSQQTSKNEAKPATNTHYCEHHRTTTTRGFLLRKQFRPRRQKICTQTPKL